MQANKSMKVILFIFIFLSFVFGIYSINSIKAPGSNHKDFVPDKNTKGSDRIIAVFEQYEKNGKIKTGSIFALLFKIEAKYDLNDWNLTESWYNADEKDRVINLIELNRSSCDSVKAVKILEWKVGKKIKLQFSSLGGDMIVDAEKKPINHEWVIKIISKYKEYDSAPVVEFAYKQVETVKFKYNNLRIY